MRWTRTATSLKASRRLRSRLCRGPRPGSRGPATAPGHLQNFEPAGVGARSPGECLTLQLRATVQTPCRDLALRIAGQHLELLASRDYGRLKAATGASEDELRG